MKSEKIGFTRDEMKPLHDVLKNDGRLPEIGEPCLVWDEYGDDDIHVFIYFFAGFEHKALAFSQFFPMYTYENELWEYAIPLKGNEKLLSNIRGVNE